MTGTNARSSLIKEKDFELGEKQRNGIKSIFTVLDTAGTGSVKSTVVKMILGRLDYKGGQSTKNSIDRILAEQGLADECVVSMEQLMEVSRSVFWNDDVNFQLGLVFKVFDDDGDGYITRDEIARVMSRIKRPLTDGQIRRMIEDGDREGDGRISFEEFRNIMMK